MEKQSILNKKTRKKFQILMMMVLIFLGISFWGTIKVSAQAIILSSEKYEQLSVEEKTFNTNFENKKESFYHEENVGTLYIMTDSAIEKSTIGSITAYEVDEDTKIKFQNNKLINWSIVSNGQKKIGNIEIDKVKEGSAVIQKSYDGINWITEEKTVQNILDPKNEGLIDICIVNFDDIKKGIYYRIYILYELKMNKGNIHSYCTEEYTFYLCYNNDPVKIVDITGRNIIQDQGEVRDGFVIENCGANSKVEVKRGTVVEKNTFESQNSFYKPGNYTIITESPTGVKKEYHITVTEGLDIYSVDRKVYANPEKEGYSKNLYFGNGYDNCSLTKMTLGTDGEKIRKGEKINGYDLYGIEGSEIYILLNVDKNAYTNNGWEIVDDDWGKKEKQTIEGTYTGVMSSGALVVQKSYTGDYWVKDDLGRYSNGLYTTDYTNVYGEKGDVLAYTIDGEDVLNGVYLRILYAYKIKQRNGEIEKRIIEEYSFYICYDSLKAITFHNLTPNDTLTKYTDDETELEILYKAETLKNNSLTRTGFSIDVSGSPTVKCYVTKNGYETEFKDSYTENGKYQIKLVGKTGLERNVTIYVDNSDNEGLLNKYFVNSKPISGKRVFSEDAYCVYEEGDNTKFIIQGISDNETPVYGKIVNLYTGKETTVYGNQNKKEYILDYGEYEITLDNNYTYKTSEPSGDNAHFVIHFKVIPNGTAPGPVVNKDSLQKHMNNSISSSYPKYYGLTFPSSGSGKITMAFKTWQAAFEYASDKEAGSVHYDEEKGIYMYTGSYVLNEGKEEYDSKWDLTDAINHFAELYIQEHYFDMSDKYSYLTLDDAVFKSFTNLNRADLNNDVTIFMDGQEEFMKDLDVLPIINDLPYAILSSGKDAIINSGKEGFVFKKDENSYDSHLVYITDSTGKRINIEYEKNVEEQLKEHNCSTGIITIVERTKYGDSTEYEAVFYANDDNTAKLILSYIIDDEERETIISQNENGINIEANHFSIEDILDELDPYDLILIKIKKDGKTKKYSFTKDDLRNAVFDESGVYDISVINRIGNKFEFYITIIPSDYATIIFEGDSTENLEPIVCKKGSTNIKLPLPERSGYIFKGYSDSDDNFYDTFVIEEVDFIGVKVLRPQWKLSKCHIIIKDVEGNILNEIDTEIDKKVKLEIPDIGKEVESWYYNDTDLVSNIISFNTEGNYEITVKYKDFTNEKENNESVSDTVESLEDTDLSKISNNNTMLIVQDDSKKDVAESDFNNNDDNKDNMDITDIIIIIVLVLLVISIVVVVIITFFKMKKI